MSRFPWSTAMMRIGVRAGKYAMTYLPVHLFRLRMRDTDDLLLAKTYLRLKQAAKAEAIVQKLLSRYPGWSPAVDFKRALETARRVLDGGHAAAEDYDLYARLSLFAGLADEQALQAAQQANLMSRRTNAHYLATVAWMHASLGDTAQARELLLEAMAAGGLDEPDREIWFGFGRIYEQYGENGGLSSGGEWPGNLRGNGCGGRNPCA